jgi:NAD(P)-dependent dehydrogenase (short-subunit alcohol dehydrogenase family)
MLNELEYTKDHIEKNFATNTFSVFYLTHLCLDLLNEQSRVITVSSGGMLTQPLVTDDIFMEK